MKNLLERLEKDLEEAKFNPANIKSEVDVITSLLRSAAKQAQVNKVESKAAIGAALSRFKGMVASLGGPAFKKAARHIEKAVDEFVEGLEEEKR